MTLMAILVFQPNPNPSRPTDSSTRLHDKRSVRSSPSDRDSTQWSKCNGTQGYTPFPHLQFMPKSVPPPQIVIMLGKAHDYCQGLKPECSVPPHMGVDHGGRDKSPQNLERGIVPQILSCCKISSIRLLALQCRKMCFCFYSRTFIVSPAMRPPPEFQSDIRMSPPLILHFNHWWHLASLCSA